MIFDHDAVSSENEHFVPQKVQKNNDKQQLRQQLCFVQREIIPSYKNTEFQLSSKLNKDQEISPLFLPVESEKATVSFFVSLLCCKSSTLTKITEILTLHQHWLNFNWF